LFTFRSGIRIQDGEKSGSEFRDEHDRLIFPRALKQLLGKKMLKFFDADPNLGSVTFLTLDPVSGMEKFGSGIRYKHPGSATLI
jgi:hypothetical protein